MKTYLFHDMFVYHSSPDLDGNQGTTKRDVWKMLGNKFEKPEEILDLVSSTRLEHLIKIAANKSLFRLPGRLRERKRETRRATA
jgi:hypothetical protein